MSRRIGLFALRLAVAAALLVLVVRLALPAETAKGATAFERLEAAWVGSPTDTWTAFALGFGLFGAGFVVAAMRFRMMLEAAGIAADLGAVLRAYLVGNLFNLVLPGLILGDVYRWNDARREPTSGNRGAAIAGIVLLERLLGFAALGTMALFALPFVPTTGELTFASTARAAIALLAAMIAGFPFLVLAPASRSALDRLARRFATVWPRAGNTALRSLGALGAVGGEAGVVAKAFGLSLVAQGLPIATVFALATPLDTGVTWVWYAVIVPVVTLASVLPISIGGTGVRELLFVALFGAAGMRAEVALALSFSTLATALAWALVGMVLFALGRRGAAQRTDSEAAART